MKPFRISIVSLLAVLLVRTTCPAIDLTPVLQPIPIAETYTGKYFFQDTGKKVGFYVDRDTNVSGGPAECLFRFGKVEVAEMRLGKSSLSPEIGFDAGGLLKYEKAARAAILDGATDVVLESQSADAANINGWTSHQYIFTYNFYGIGFRQSITFINFNAKEQLQVIVRSRAADYATVYGRSYLILNSFYEYVPGMEERGT